MTFESFLKIFEEHYKGVLLLVLLLLTIVYVIDWLSRIFVWGRYRRINGPSARNDRDRIIADFFARLINDFRHLLAIMIVVIFACMVFYTMEMTTDFEEKMKALQLVIASLGGLLGSIIGYYFGESAVRRSQTRAAPSTTSESDVPEAEPIVEAPVARGIAGMENKKD